MSARRRAIGAGLAALLAACGSRGGGELQGPALVFFYTDG
jgi:hypothetical protein